MVEHTLDREKALLIVRPKGALEREDFEALAKTVDPFLEEQGALAGLIIDAPGFPGWDSMGALIGHLRFVRDHHKQLRRVALVTDSKLADAAEHLAAHFVAAEIKHFAAGALDAAKAWVLEA